MVLKVDLIQEVGHSLEGFREGVQLDAEDVADLLGTSGSKGVDAGGVVPGDVGFESHELRDVVGKFFLALAQGSQVSFCCALSVGVVEGTVQALPKFLNICSVHSVRPQVGTYNIGSSLLEYGDRYRQPVLVVTEGRGVCPEHVVQFGLEV